MKKGLIIGIGITFLFVSLISAYQVRTIYNPFTSKLDYIQSENYTGYNVTADRFIGNLTGSITGNSNSTTWWNNMNTINSTQMQNNGGILNILVSWLNAGWCKLTGCTMLGNIQMGSNNINGSGNFTTTGMGQFAWIDKLAQSIGTTPAPPNNTLRLYVEDFKNFSVYKYQDSGGMVRELIRDSVFIVKRVAASNVSKMSAVYACASTGDGVPVICLAKANSITTMPVIGITIENITSGSYGRIMQVGLLENLDTSSWATGDILYLSPTTFGGLTNVQPVTPNLTQEVGTVLVSSATIGKIQVLVKSLTGNEFGTINNFNVVGNVSANYFKGNGSLLTDIAVTEQDLAWNGNYSIFTGLINNESYLSTYNITYAGCVNNASYLSTYNATYASNMANNSFNQSLTDLLYSNIKWGYNMTTAAYDLYNAVWLSTYNSTYASWAYNQTTATYNLYNAVWSSTYNSTYAANLDTNDSDYIATNEANWLSTYNSTYAGYSTNVSINYTLQTYIVYDSRWTSTFNTTYSNILNQNCPTGQIVNGTLINGTIICTTVTGSMDYTNIAMTNITETWDTGQNITMGTGGWFKGLFNWIIGTISSRYLYFNGTDLNFNETSLNSTIVTQGISAGFNSTSNDTYSATTSAWNGNSTALIGCINNASYLRTDNATYATWAYNQTTPAIAASHNKSADINPGTYNITLGDNKYICLGDSGCADSYIYFNGSSLITRVN